MKTSTVRLILLFGSIFPALSICSGFAAYSIISFFRSANLSDLAYGLPFVFCLIIYGMFARDTLELFKDGK